jgi:DNA-binding response OmpR family regulator
MRKSSKTVLWNNYQIVIADYSEKLVSVYDEYLTSAGLTIVAKFYKTQDVISYIRSQDPSNPAPVLFLGDNFPEMSGIEFAQILKQVRPDLKIIFGTVKDPSEIIGLPFLDAALQKPFTISEFLDAVRKVASPPQSKGSLLLNDQEKLENLTHDIVEKSHEKQVIVLNSISIRSGRDLPGHTPSYILSRSKGLEVYLITVITPENVLFCRQLMINQGIQVRHLDGINENFSVWDKKYSLEYVQTPTNNFRVGHLFFTNLESLVNKNQFLFDEMWQIAIPAEKKIAELEMSYEEDNVSVVSGRDAVVDTRLNIVRHAHSHMDACIIPSLLSSILEIGGLREAQREAASRGVRFRILTEVTKEDAGFCTRLLAVEGIEMRHLSGIKGAFSLNEKELMVSAASEDPEKNRPYSSIYSTYSDFVDQHRAIFNILWDIATPASVKIAELEEKEEIRKP